MQTQEIKTRANWIVDPSNSRIGFHIKHIVFMNLHLAGGKYDGGISIKKDDFATIETGFWINPKSIPPQKKQNFAPFKRTAVIDVEKFKGVSFDSNMLLELIRSGHYISYGGFFMNGICKQMLTGVETNGRRKDILGREKILFNINGTVKKKNGGLIWSATITAGEFLISEEVWIHCTVHLIRAK